MLVLRNRHRFLEMLEDEDRELSLTSLVQLQRVVLDTVKLLDRGEGNDEPPLGSLTKSGRRSLVTSPLRKTPDE